MARVHVLGSLNVDHAVRVARHPAVGETVRGHVLAVTPGGKGLNQAVAAAMASGLTGTRVYLYGTVGADEAGRWLVNFAADHGVSAEHVRVHPTEQTGSAWITVAEDGANTVIVDPAANQMTTFEAGSVGLSAQDVVVVQLEVPHTAVAGLLTAARSAGALSVFNPSPAGAGRELVADASVVVLNEHELRELSGVASAGSAAVPEAIGQLAERMRQPEQIIVVTLGPAGAVAVGPDGMDVVHGIPTHAVDTTGAGDCFLGVLAASRAGGLTPVDALRRANRAAARSVTRPGAAQAMPTDVEIDSTANTRSGH